MRQAQKIQEMHPTTGGVRQMDLVAITPGVEIEL